MGMSLKRYMPIYDAQAKVSFSICCCDPTDLPKYDETRRLTCGGDVLASNVITYADDKVTLSKFLGYSKNPKDFDPLQHIDITLPYILKQGD